MDINDIILKEAFKDEGMKELKGNTGWEDPEFQQQMEMTGWELGQSWCAYWAEKVWTNAYAEYNSLMVNVLRRLFSANAVETFENFKDSPAFVASGDPVLGAVVIWMKKHEGRPSYIGESKKWIRGHAGLVIGMNEGGSFNTLEGNSNSEGGRQGIEVARLERRLNFNTADGLQLLGFIHPNA